MLPTAPAFMLPTAHLHHHHHHYQPILGSQPTDPQWQAHPHFHMRKAGRRVDLGEADAVNPSPMGPVPAADAAAGSFDISPEIGTPTRRFDAAVAPAAGGGGSGRASELHAVYEGFKTTSPGHGGGTTYGGVSRAGNSVVSGVSSSYTVGGGAGFGGAAFGGASGRPRYPRLHNLQWLWSAMAWYWSTVAWVVTLPWRIFTAVSPGFTRPAEQWVEHMVTRWTGMPVRLATDVLYGTISWFDGMVSYIRGNVVTTHKSNMHHFWVAYEAYLRLIQHKAHLVEKHGIDGLWMALHTKTV